MRGGPVKTAKQKQANVKGRKAQFTARKGHAAKKSEVPTPTPRGWSLSTLEAVRRRLAQIATDISRGAIADQKARTLTYILNSVAMILRAEAELRIEERILELERAAGIAPTFEPIPREKIYAAELVSEN